MWHDVVEMPSAGAYETCDLDSNWTTLSPFSLPDGSTAPEHVSYYYPCTIPNATAYLTCSVPGHCSAGQKIKIHTSATDFALNPHNSSEWLIHVESIPRLLRLLNYHEGDDGLFVMNHGYQTEELATQTHELTWCAMDHCPNAAREFDDSATQGDCESILYTLLGFVTRKRPIPQWESAIQYYQQAIERGGNNICAAHSYLAQLYWSRGKEYVPHAQNQTRVLCQTCAATNPLLVQQAHQEFSKHDHDVTVWPNDECPLAWGSEPTIHSSGSRTATNIHGMAPRSTWMVIIMTVWWLSCRRG